jgi:hypothetical protein
VEKEHQEQNIRHITEIKSNFSISIIQFILSVSMYSLVSSVWLEDIAVWVFILFYTFIFAYFYTVKDNKSTFDFIIPVHNIIAVEQPKLQFTRVISELKVREKVLDNQIRFWNTFSIISIILILFGAFFVREISYDSFDVFLLALIFTLVVLFYFLKLLNNRQEKIMEMTMDYEIELQRYLNNKC